MGPPATTTDGVQDGSVVVPGNFLSANVSSFEARASYPCPASSRSTAGGLKAYEIVKATAAITLSTRLFKRNEERTTREWEEVRMTLGI
jgi:hypothetical protein